MLCLRFLYCKIKLFIFNSIYRNNVFQIKESVDKILFRNKITVILEYDIITQDEVNAMDR